LTFWFPDQDAARPVPYPWVARTTRDVTGNNTTIMNATIVNAWQGVRIGPEWNELHTIRNLHMTALKTGLSIDTVTDIGRLNQVLVSPRVWEQSGLPGAPEGAARDACRAWQAQAATGVDIGRSDWEYIHEVRLEGLAVGFRFRQGERGTTNAVMVNSQAIDCGSGLVLDSLNGIGLAFTGCELRGREHGVLAPASFQTVATFHSCQLAGRQAVALEGPGLLSFQNCSFAGTLDASAGQVACLGGTFAEAEPQIRLGTAVARARLLGNTFAGEPRIVDETDLADVAVSPAPVPAAKPDLSRYVPAPVRTPPRRALFLVTDHGADPEAADNTPAFARAFEAARAAGGGTVYVPAGLYRFQGSLRVPGGVELRGCFDVPHHTVSAGSVLLPLAGRGEEDGAPFLELEAGAGLRGLTVWYPEQSLVEPTPYPWTVRGLGPGCWIEDVTLGNTWQGVDFGSYDSTGHLVRYLAGCAFRRALWVSKSAGPGWVEDLQFNPHYALRLHRALPRAPIPPNVGVQFHDFLREHLEGFVFGRCADERIFATFLFAAFDGIAFRDDDGGSTARVFIHGSDTVSRPAALDAATEVEFVAAQLVPLSKWERGAIVSTPGFTGQARFFNTQVWAGTCTADLNSPGAILIDQMNTLSGGFQQTAGNTVLRAVNLDRDLAPHVAVAGGTCELFACQFRHGPLRWTGEGVRAFASSASLLGAFPRGELAPGTFALDWEDGEAPGFVDQLSPGGGRRSVPEATCQPLEQPDAVSGKRAVRMAGKTVKGEHGYIYFKLADGPVAIYPDSVLSYAVKPLDAEGAHVAVDAVLDEGRPLRDRGLVDTERRGAHPGGAKGPVGEWTRIRLPLGKLSGRTIQHFMFAYDHRVAAEDPFTVLVDDLRVESALAGLGDWRIAATSDAGGLTLAGPAPIRYTLDGSNPTADSPLYDKAIPRPETGVREVRYAPQFADGTLAPLVFVHLLVP
ncbi:MAG: chitobiase/beta-hexosaminidase C-terminal domain-containing protein, partial [Lentisphaeria bacterium]|nr:chitobiase/beta-hexosaminidase C-terminal domain-containing protein [Lentisphaeria bacterium]